MPIQQWKAYDYRLRFEWEEPELDEVIESIILPDWKKAEVGPADAVFKFKNCDGLITVELNGHLVIKNLTVNTLYQSLKRECHMALATHAQDLVFVHSGVVLTSHGLLLIPGRSFSGKSTLVRSLVAHGGLYFSDEYAVIDEEGLVRPFPRAHCERLSDGGHRYTHASELGWTREQNPRPIRAVVCTCYQKGEAWRPKILSRGDAVLKMLENTVSALTEPQHALNYLARSVTSAVCIQTPRGESEETASLLLEWMSQLD